MIDGPLISVVMPVYNAERYVSHAIGSIIGQTYTNWELLICDDGSSDNSLIEIKKFSDTRIRIFLNQKNIGSLLTRNFLFTKVKGNLVALQDADDFSLPDRFLEQANLFKDNTPVMMCGTWARYIKGKSTVKLKESPVTWEAIKDSIRITNSFCSASIMFRASLLEKGEPYRPYFRLIGNYDYDFTSRIAESYPTVNIPSYLYVVTLRAHSNSRVQRMNNPLKFESANIVRAFINEREIYGADSLERGDNISLKNIEANALLPYDLDPWLVYDRVLNDYIDLKFYGCVFEIVFQSFLRNPLSRRPYKFLFYAIKRIF